MNARAADMWGVRCCRRDKKICKSDERSESAGSAHPATRQFLRVFQISKYAAAIAAAAIPVTKANIVENSTTSMSILMVADPALRNHDSVWANYG